MIELERVSELIHIWYRCHNCGMQPIVGQRFECQTCPSGPDNDLCEKCRACPCTVERCRLEPLSTTDRAGQRKEGPLCIVPQEFSRRVDTLPRKPKEKRGHLSL